MASPFEQPPAPRFSPARLALPVAVALVVVAAGVLLLEGDVFDDSLPALGGRDAKCWRYRSAERAFARKMNRARQRRRVHRLSIDPELGKVARKHTKEMIRRNLLYHTSQAVLGRRVTRWSYLGENVGVGHTVTSLHRAFMNSAGHRHNILMSRFRHLGVGAKQQGGRLWVTVIFESRLDPDTRLRMPRC
jgi:uncharacterized protein YkwD